MNAKEAREYAKQQLSVVQGNNKLIFDSIIDAIKTEISRDPTKNFIAIEIPPKQVIAWLESKEYGYETAQYQTGPNESSLKISWDENGIKVYGYQDR